MKIQTINRLFSTRAAMMLLMMLLTTASAWAEEVTALYAVTFNTTTKKTTLTHNGGNYESVTWDYISGTNATPWNAGATHGVDDEYDITFKPDKYLTLVNYDIKTSAETKFTVTVGASGYYIKSASIAGVTVPAGLNAKTIDVTVPTHTDIKVLSVTLTTDNYHTVTPASGLHVTSGTTATEGGTTYYKAGATVTVAPTNQYHIVEGTGGTGSATATIAADKRSFSFTMPEQNVSPTATLTEVHTISSPNGLTVTTSPYFTDNTTKYYKKGETYTLTVDDANKVIKTFSATGASGSSVASDKRSATVTIGSSNITVSATLLTISGSCGTGLTWSMSDTDSNGTYDRLTLSGSGTLSTSPWDTDFAASISHVDVSSANIAISSNPFSALAADVVIVVPTLAYAVSYANAAFASKLRVQFGSYLFGATNEGGTTAYKIATGDDLRNFASAVNAGNGCTNLLAVILYTETPPTLGSSAFKDCTALDAIYVPAGTAETYQAADGWKDYAGKIRAIDGSYGDNVYYAYNSTTKTLYIFGTGYMTEYFGELIIPWDNYRTDITTVIIGHGVTSIGSMAFNGCTGLTSIEIPASVMTIGHDAFNSCTSLLSVTIYAPELSEYGYGYGAFYNNADGRKIYVFKNCVKTYKEQAWKTDDDRGMGFYEDDILPIESINLKDNDDNSSLIAAANGNALGALNVTLKGRTLYKDGKWNTLCLPFDVTVGSGVMADATAMTLNGSESGFNASTGELTLNFDAVTSGSTITAGTPFIVKWTGKDVTNPVFSGVTVSSTTPGSVTSTDGYVTFISTYSPVPIYADPATNLYLGAENKLYYPSSAKDINSFRGYFQLKGLTAGEPDTSTGVRAFVLNFGDEETTGIIDIEHGTLNMEHSADAGWYDLSGRRLSGKPTKPGLYINNGRKVLVSDKR